MSASLGRSAADGQAQARGQRLAERNRARGEREEERAAAAELRGRIRRVHLIVNPRPNEEEDERTQPSASLDHLGEVGDSEREGSGNVTSEELEHFDLSPLSSLNEAQIEEAVQQSTSALVLLHGEAPSVTGDQVFQDFLRPEAFTGQNDVGLEEFPADNGPQETPAAQMVAGDQHLSHESIRTPATASAGVSALLTEETTHQSTEALFLGTLGGSRSPSAASNDSSESRYTEPFRDPAAVDTSASSPIRNVVHRPQAEPVIQGEAPPEAQDLSDRSSDEESSTEAREWHNAPAGFIHVAVWVATPTEADPDSFRHGHVFPRSGHVYGPVQVPQGPLVLRTLWHAFSQPEVQVGQPEYLAALPANQRDVSIYHSQVPVPFHGDFDEPHLGFHGISTYKHVHTSEKLTYPANAADETVQKTLDAFQVPDGHPLYVLYLLPDNMQNVPCRVLSGLFPGMIPRIRKGVLMESSGFWGSCARAFYQTRLVASTVMKLEIPGRKEQSPIVTSPIFVQDVALWCGAPVKNYVNNNTSVKLGYQCFDYMQGLPDSERSGADIMQLFPTLEYLTDGSTDLPSRIRLNAGEMPAAWQDLDAHQLIGLRNAVRWTLPELKRQISDFKKAKGLSGFPNTTSPEDFMNFQHF
ncbi:hypothetical protein SISSUDRAFT_1063907 [Sistotremastrum suecicum HHB10207 ss-3]|uniref:Uncharacterized protein n=1 Tax=Sistotremastrum suecicum HHB10207 ss-3 TaxID=1314776 RepID=A0A166B921_9AGAM|nr:hypothetical protein SISSUDRAFT_1063907 [Sistotremastrum suecicum HHB10207 ss-3]